MKKFFIGLVFMVVTLFASENPSAVVVFDASGSMWGKVDGKTKIAIAKDALKNVVNKWNPNVELGLIAYGHRRKGDCDDIEAIIPVGAIDKNKMISTILEIMPKGKTPISRSLKKAAQELRYTEEKATVILISDGKETCDLDPCKTAQELEAMGIDFVIHVIGFNVDQKTDEQLECIANATGGEYFSAKNATALNEAMKRIVKKVETVEKVEPKPVIKKIKNNLEITASETEGGKWIKAYIRDIKNQDGESIKSGYYTDKKKAKIFQLPVGKYSMDMSYNEFKKKDIPFEIKSDDVAKLHVVFEQFIIEPTCTDANSKVSYEVYARSGQMVFDKVLICSKALRLSLDEGDYSVEAKVDNITKDVQFTIGKDEKISIDLRK